MVKTTIQFHLSLDSQKGGLEEGLVGRNLNNISDFTGVVQNPGLMNPDAVATSFGNSKDPPKQRALLVHSDSQGTASKANKVF